jgi:hypothetical protein
MDVHYSYEGNLMINLFIYDFLLQVVLRVWQKFEL